MQKQNRVCDGVKDLTGIMLTSTRRQDRGFTTVSLQQNTIIGVLNQLLNLLKASPRRTSELPPGLRYEYLEYEDSTDGHQIPRGRSPSPRAMENHERSRKRLDDLLKILNVEIDTAAEDASSILRIISSLSSGSQDRAVALIMSPTMQTWLTSAVSLPLLVNGHMFSTEGETRQSPLSYFCAKLVDGISPCDTSSQKRTNRKVFAVRWFCGQHTNMYDYGPGMTDYDAHPPGMLNNMLAQLITQLLECPFLPQLEDLALTRQDPQLVELCTLFDLLVRALPKGSILFVVIDGISYYEDEERGEECMEVLSTLTELTRESSESANGCLVKLLVTAPLRSQYVLDLFDDTEILDLDEYIPPNGGFTALQWEMGVGRVIADE